MNNKLLTAAIIITISILGVGAVTLMRTDSREDASTQTHSSNDTTPHAQADQKTPDATSSDMVATANRVTYKDFAVVEKTIKVKKGTTVTWTNQDTAKHDVTPTVETADFKASPLFGKGETYQVTFNTVGTYGYFCSPHPYMKGTIEVTE